MRKGGESMKALKANITEKEVDFLKLSRNMNKCNKYEMICIN